MNAAKKTPQDALSFEEAYKQLQAIVTSLDSGQGDLEESLASFERGMQLLKICRDKLDGASRRIELLKGMNEGGEPILEELDEDGLRSQAGVAGRQASLPDHDESSECAKSAESTKRQGLLLIEAETDAGVVSSEDIQENAVESISKAGKQKTSQSASSRSGKKEDLPPTNGFFDSPGPSF